MRIDPYGQIAHERQPMLTNRSYGTAHLPLCYHIAVDVEVARTDDQLFVFLF